MNTKNELEALIRKYEHLIHFSNNLFQETFKTSLPPLLAKRKGIIPVSGTLFSVREVISYRFHGMGCRLEFSDGIVEFDYVIGDFVYRDFDPQKLFWFVESFSGASEVIKDRANFQKKLLDLELEGVIKRSADGFLFQFIS